jgi:hypothetical protein
MTVGDGVAIYAAVVSTVVAGFRVAEWRKSREPDIVVEPRFAYLGMTDGEVVEIVRINVHNHADHALRVTSAGLNLQDGSGRTITPMGSVPGATIPGVIEGHDSGNTYFLLDGLVSQSGIDIRRPVVAWASTSTGKTFTSKNKPLIKEG